MWQNIALVAIGGALGSLGRYGLSSAINHFTGRDFPWGTFVVNALGCLLFGLLAAAADTKFQLSPAGRMLLLTGFLGAFTTFSTYSYDSVKLGQDGDLLPMAANILGQNAAGMVLLFAGLAVGKLVLAR